MKQKSELEEATAAKEKEVKEAAELKEKMVEDLKKELEELKAQASKNINNSGVRCRAPGLPRGAHLQFTVST